MAIVLPLMLGSTDDLEIFDGTFCAILVNTSKAQNFAAYAQVDSSLAWLIRWISVSC